MKLSRTHVAMVLGAGAVIGAGWLIASPSSQQAAPLSSAQAAITETGQPASAVATPPAASAAVASAMHAPAVARLGNVAVRQDEMEQLLRSLPPATRDQLKEDRPALDQWLRARLAEEALLAQAVAQGWKERPEIKQLTDAAERQVVLQTYLESVSQVPAAYPSQEELQAAYEANKAQFTTPAQYRVSQIFLVAPYQDAEAVAKMRKQAGELVKKARADKADFAALVKEHSQDEATAARGGDTGWAPLQQLVPEIRTSVAALDKGAVSEPIQSQAGFHILKLVDQRAPVTPELAQVQEQLREALRRQRKSTVAKAYLEGLVDAGTLSIDGATLNAAFDAVP
ncbi:PpiC-type peptidyl-prolyl cis-trans isomerase [Pusillimonas sp. T7-7]|uniref:peptidylprolyl isomerase n=1 Tax=Pusillimonas sp. (strain T7-7) TaxID=1007105 RepID=UPI0002084AE6|nr:peptidylprolyl isomerase [Pusillimonas sp. T7-7]AEC18800.1 PpiC-type peptidyl-prolyl cis-trans isomerase [Pusillimonas sp. T7-7]